VELAPEAAVTAADLDLARHLRETLRPLALSAATGDEPPPEAAPELIAFLKAHDDPLRLAGAAEAPGLGRLAPKNAAAALGRVARQAADHLTGPERHALKSCPESDCRGVFSDPDGRRRWCPSPACASRGRVRAHRARKASAAAG
jgi:predicted RNA-binding Zn ribbon-like protein